MKQLVGATACLMLFVQKASGGGGGGGGGATQYLQSYMRVSPNSRTPNIPPKSWNPYSRNPQNTPTLSGRAVAFAEARPHTDYRVLKRVSPSLKNSTS